LLLQARPLGSVADDDLAARPGHAQECADVLLHRDPADVGGNRPRHVEEVFAARLEHLGIDAALPAREIREAVGSQFAAKRSGAHHAAGAGAVEAAQHPVRSLDGNRETSAQVLRKLRVIGRREPQTRAHAELARTQAQRTLGGDVQRLGREVENRSFDRFRGEQRQADFRVGRARDAAKVAGIERLDFVTEAAQPPDGLPQRANHTVGLRCPCVRHDHDSHAREDCASGMTIR